MPKNAPLVSVLTVVRNAVDDVDATLESVRAQRFEPVEHVVVDGGSTDGTLERLEARSEWLSSWVSEPDSGIADAMNKAGARAGGDLLVFLGAGDTFVDEEALARAIEAIPEGVDVRRSILYGDAVYVHASGTSVIRAEHEALGERNSLCHQSVLLGRDVQAENAYDERLNVFMDYDVWLRCLGRYPFVKLPVVISRFRAGGTSGSDALAVEMQVERTVVRLLNRQAPRTAATVAALLGEISSVATKRALRSAIGPNAYLRLKRLVGRDTPSVWAPPDS